MSDQTRRNRLNPLTESLLSTSELVEKNALKAKLPTSEALSRTLEPLEVLGELTHQSLRPVAPAPVPAPTPAAAPIPAPAAPQTKTAAQAKTPVEYATSKPEYRGALKNQKLVEALLAFHRESRPARRPPRASSSSAAARPPQFQPARAPSVAAETKPTRTSPGRKTPGSAFPILRSKPSK